jgi:2,3-dihydroxybiphenyl 1,2-dioxygenase
MSVQALGYVGFNAGNLDDWKDFGSNFLGMQLADKSRSSLAFRMDDRKQRLLFSSDRDVPVRFFGWEVADAAALAQVAARLEGHKVEVTRLPKAVCDERHVADAVACTDPAGNRVEIFHGAEIATDAFKPGRPISGFRTGPLGMGHVVLITERIDEVIAFYQTVLDFKLSDYTLRPFKAYFLHVNPRHHSLAFLEGKGTGMHHLMMELFSIDDVGHTYDKALMEEGRIATTLGRHLNDYVFSFYSRSPSDFFVEYGWGGRNIDVESWQPAEVTGGPSLWGHERSWLPPDKQEEARALRLGVAESGVRLPVTVSEGQYAKATESCAWWDAIKQR